MKATLKTSFASQVLRDAKMINIEALAMLEHSGYYAFNPPADAGFKKNKEGVVSWTTNAGNALSFSPMGEKEIYIKCDGRRHGIPWSIFWEAQNLHFIFDESLEVVEMESREEWHPTKNRDKMWIVDSTINLNLIECYLYDNKDDFDEAYQESTFKRQIQKIGSSKLKNYEEYKALLEKVYNNLFG